MTHENDTFSESGPGGDSILRLYAIRSGERGGELIRMITLSRDCQHQRQGVSSPCLGVAHQPYTKELARIMSWDSITCFSETKV